MKRYLVLFALLAGSLFAQSETISLGSRGRLTIYLSDKWRFDVSDFGDRQIVSIKPKDDTNADCTLTVTYPEVDRFDTKARLKQRVEIDGVKYEELSVEGKSRGQPFNIQTGYGFYCNFTDPKLVGARPKKGDYKTISLGLIRLTPEILIEVSIQADGFNSAPYNELLGGIEGMEYAPRRR
jgi:hypothetical protein